HAHFVPDDDLTAELYETACDALNAGGIAQYEISNFARPGAESRHNLKYWTRQPYLGFGLDAHSMLLPSEDNAANGVNAIRLAMPDSLEQFMGTPSLPRRTLPIEGWGRANCLSMPQQVSRAAALEETFFLG